MALPLIPILAKLAVSLGPTLLRKIGLSKGGTASVVADAVANAIEGNHDQSESDQQAAVSTVLRGLSPEQVNAFCEMQVDLERIKHEGDWRELENERERIKADGAARLAELTDSDLYTKRTRPAIARQSWYLAAAYVLGGNVCDVIYGTQIFSWEIFTAISSPAMLYMGVRGLEKWKGGGVKQ